MQRPIHRLAAILVSVLLVNIVCFPTESRCATIDWINPAGGSYQVGANWSGGSVPGAGDRARFGLLDTPVTVTIDASVSNERLIVASGADVTFLAEPFTLTASDFSGTSVTVGDVASTFPARLHLESGNIGAVDVTLGEAVGAVGIGTVGFPSFGEGPTWNAARTFRIGAAGTGTLILGSGVTSGQTLLGDASTGSGFLHADSSFLSLLGNLTVGHFGAGTMLITGKSVLGTATVTIGDQSGSRGLIHLVANNEWTLGAPITIGNAGDGTLLVAAGGTIACSMSTSVARLPGSHGRFDINGGSVLILHSLNVGGDDTTAGGAGSFALNAGSIAVAQTLRAWTNGHIDWTGGDLVSRDVELRQGGRMSISDAGAPKVLHVKRLQVDATGATRLDLNGNAAVVDWHPTIGSPFADLRQRIAQGFAGGSWTGDGITSTFAASTPIADALGIAEVSQLGITEFLNGPVDNTTVIIRYTFAGDANLDGSVSLFDFNQLAAHFGQTGKSWFDGDFNYDGAVNLTDFNLLAQNFGQSLPAHFSATQIPEPQAALILAVTVGIAPRRLFRYKIPRPHP